MFTAAFALGASPALAACPQTAVQDGVNLWLAAESSQASAVSALGVQADTLAAACATDAYIQKIAALTHATLSGRLTDPAAGLDHAAKARAFAMRMRDVQPANEHPVTAMAGSQPIAIRIFGDEFDKDILLNLFGTEQRAGRLSPESQPLKPGEQVRACRDWDAVEAQQITAIIRDNPKADLPGAMNQLDRMAAACALRIEEGDHERIVGQRAKAIHVLLFNVPMRPDALLRPWHFRQRRCRTRAALRFLRGRRWSHGRDAASPLAALAVATGGKLSVVFFQPR